MKVNSDIGLLPPDPASFFLSTSPIHQNYHKHHLSIRKNGLSLSTRGYLSTYLPTCTSSLI